MCDEVIDDCLPALKFIPAWFAANKTNKKLLTSSYANDNNSVLTISKILVISYFFVMKWVILV